MNVAWGVSTLLGQWFPGIEEGRTQCGLSAISEQCLPGLGMEFKDRRFALLQSFTVRKHLRPGATLRA